MTDSVLMSVRPQFRALATTLLPEIRALDSVGWQRTEALIESMLVDRPPEVRRQVRRFIRIANLLPVFRYGSTFVRLPEARRARFLQALERAPVLAVRRGVWRLRTLVCMGYHGQDPSRRYDPLSGRPNWSRPRGRLEPDSVSSQARPA